MPSGSFHGISAEWSVAKVASHDQPTRCTGKVEAKGASIPFSAFVRWCSYRGWTKEEVGGCRVLAVLEAAHIAPYRGESDNHVKNGLLLRSDLHTLFDLNLLGIELTTLRIHIADEARIEYGAFHGQHLEFGVARPSQAALESRFEGFQRKAARSSH
jgi:hypothetical protein